MIRRIPRTRQHDVTDCGAACLHSIARYYGRRLPISRIRLYAGTDRDGTTMLGVIAAAGRLGFTARGVKGPPESLGRIPLPAIAHVVKEGGALHHYVVIYSVTRKRVTVMDPGDGRLHRLSHAAFREMWSGMLVLLAPAGECRRGDETTSVAMRFWALVRPYRSVMAQALVGAVVYTLLGLSTAVYVQKIVDYVIGDENGRLLDLLTAVMVATLSARAYLDVGKSFLSLRTGQRMDALLIVGYYRHLLSLPQRFFDTMRVGEIVSRVNDAVKIRAFINDVALDLVVSVLVVIFSLGLMLVYSVRLTVLVSGLLVLQAGIYVATNRANRSAGRRVMERAADLESHLVESLESVAMLKRFGAERLSSERTEARLVRLLRSVYRSGTISILSGSGTGYLGGLFTVIALWVGTRLVLRHELTPGELMSFYALIGYLIGPIGHLVAANRTMQDALIAADRLFEIMDLESEEGGRIELTRERMGDVRFSGVAFRYGAREPVFDSLDLTIRQGTLTGIVGESGSGKSTLAALLQKLHLPDAGRIRIGDVDLREASNESVRRRIVAVPQKVSLLSGDVMENVALGDPDPDAARVLAICRSLGMDELVESLPRGYATPLGAHGAGLSGGQRQRLAIARAIYRDPDVLILDEATSNLDSIAEQHVRRVARELVRAGRTVIIIAHRLGTIEAADHLVVLAGGRVAEEGTHRELMRLGGHYERLWRHQFPPIARDPPGAPAGDDLATPCISRPAIPL